MEKRNDRDWSVGTQAGYICNQAIKSSDSLDLIHWKIGGMMIRKDHSGRWKGKGTCTLVWPPDTLPHIDAWLTCLPIHGFTARLCIGSLSLQHRISMKGHLHFYFAIHHIRSCFAFVCDRNKTSLFLSSAAYKLKGVSNGSTMSQLKHSFSPENNLQAVELTIFFSNVWGQIKDR